MTTKKMFPVSCIRSGSAYYQLFRRIENGRGVWAAQEIKMGNPVGDLFPITYEQARGFEPIRPDAVSALARTLGRMLLPPRAGRR